MDSRPQCPGIRWSSGVEAVAVLLGWCTPYHATIPVGGQAEVLHRDGALPVGRWAEAVGGVWGGGWGGRRSGGRWAHGGEHNISAVLARC